MMVQKVQYRAPFSRWCSLAAVAVWGLILFATNPLVTVFEDEASFVAGARKSVAETIAAFRSGGEFAHPPLYDVLLHFWLRATGEAFGALRIPSIVFYCLALWIVAEIAGLLWDRRWTALVLGVAWPTGFYLGRPAGWYSLAMLELAALTWVYFRWRATGRSKFLAALAAGAVLLVYTNYFGWMFLAVLAADLWLDPADRRRSLRFVAALVPAAVAFWPLLAVLRHEVVTEVSILRRLPELAKSAYLAHSLLASESVAPWTAPGLTAAAAGLVILGYGWRHPLARRPLLWLAAPFAVAVGTGILTGTRLALFGPWLLLFLAAVTGTRAVRVAVGVVFAMGWLGVVSNGRFAGTFRYIEPWREAAAEIWRLSQPGDAILAFHPSFFFHLSYLIEWPRTRSVPDPPLAVQGRTLYPLYRAEQALASGPRRVIYVRTTFNNWCLSFDQSLLAIAPSNPLRRWLRDAGVRWKHRLFPGVFQPGWRIEVYAWTPTG